MLLFLLGFPSGLVVDHGLETSRPPLAKRIYSAPYGRTHEMVVHMSTVDVRSNQHLVTRPCAGRELNADPVHLFGCIRFIRRERLDVVIEECATAFSPRLLRRHELIERVCGNAVHARRAERILSHLRLVRLETVVNHTAQCRPRTVSAALVSDIGHCCDTRSTSFWIAYRPTAIALSCSLISFSPTT